MAGNMYQYGTSPRKIQPEYNPKKRKKQNNNKKSKNSRQKNQIKRKKQQNDAIKQIKRKHNKNIVVIIGLFLVLLTISYRNSLITEKFNQIQSKKQELAAIEKTNGQTEVSIESSLNLKNLEKSAKKKLGMQRLENDQKVYVTLPKKDYTESATPEVKEDNNTNFIQKIIEKFFK